MAETIKKKKKIGRPRKERRGGAREGAGRKRGVQIKEHPRNKHFSFGVSEITVQRSNKLRELTKQDEMPFVDMLEKWVEELAQEYGIE